MCVRDAASWPSSPIERSNLVRAPAGNVAGGRPARRAPRAGSALHVRIARYIALVLATATVVPAAVSAGTGGLSVHVQRPRGVAHSGRVYFRAAPLHKRGDYY